MPLDIGIGILAALGVAELFEFQATPLFIAAGIAFALLPDIDVIPAELTKNLSIHRTYTHYPIFYVAGFLFLLFLGFPEWGTLFLVGGLLHLIHDTVGLGCGISWLWPITPRKFRFFPDKEGKISSQFFMTWMPEEEPALIRAHHNPHWVRDFYFRPNIVAYVEYGGLLVALIVLYLYFT